MVWLVRHEAVGQLVTHNYAIEIAGIKVGTLKAERHTGASGLVYSQVSNTEFWFFGKIKIHYKTVAQCSTSQQLQRSDVDATTSKGNFKSTVEWRGDHYTIQANQYKYERQATEKQPVMFVTSRLFFEEPSGQRRIFSEYFGDFAVVEPTSRGSYRVRVHDREDEYFYEKGQLVRIVKKNPLKNFVIRRVD